MADRTWNEVYGDDCWRSTLRRCGDESTAQDKKAMFIRRPWCRCHHGTGNDTAAAVVTASVFLARRKRGGTCYRAEERTT